MRIKAIKMRIKMLRIWYKSHKASKKKTVKTMVFEDISTFVGFITLTTYL